jgi:hypothetical protein
MNGLVFSMKEEQGSNSTGNMDSIRVLLLNTF